MRNFVRASKMHGMYLNELGGVHGENDCGNPSRKESG